MLRRKGYLTRFSLDVAAIGLLLAMISGLDSATGGSSTSAAPKLVRVDHLLNWIPSGIHAPLYYGLQRGFYKDEGIDIVLHKGRGTTVAIDGIASGKFHFANAGTGPAVLGIGEGRDILSIGTMYGRFSYGFFVDADSDIKKVSDLEGREVLATAASVETPLFPAIWELSGTNASKVTIINVDAAAKLTSYAAGKGDAMVTSVPYGFPIVNPKRPSRVIAWADYGVKIPDYSFLTTRDTAKKNPDLVRRYLRATYRSFVEAAKDPEGAVRALIRLNPDIDLPFDAKLEEFIGFTKIYCSEAMGGMPLGRHAEADWKFTVETLHKLAGLKPPLKHDRFYTNAFFDDGAPVSSVTCPHP